MADLSDVTAYLAQQAFAAIYPNGTSQPSVAGIDCRIYEGWPNPDQLDLDLAGKTLVGATNNVPLARPGGMCANVSIFPLAGTGVTVYQVLDATYTITPPAPQLAWSLSGDTLTASGTPAAGEYLTVIADQAHVYSASAATLAALLSNLASQAQTNYPSASATATTLTVPVEAYLTVRQGAPALLGKVTHRQRQGIMVTVWAPTQAARSSLAKAIDGLIKQELRVTLADTSQAIVCYNRTYISDEGEVSTVYRRDLVYDVEYASLQTFAGYPVTSVQTSIIDAAQPSTTALAVT